MEEYIAKRKPYASLKKRVEAAEEAIENGGVGGSGSTYDIVVPAKGSRGNAKFEESIPGLVKLYNESAGLGLDNYGQLGIAWATESDIDAGTSMKKPIVPGTLAYALSVFLPNITDEVVQSFITKGCIGDFSDGPEGMYPAASYFTRKFVESVVEKLGLEVAVEVLAQNQAWEMPPSTLAVVAPYEAKFTGTDNENGNSTHTISLTDVTVLFSTGKVNNENVMDSDGDCYRCMAIYKGTLTYSSSHKRYKLNSIKVTNTDAGNMYVYYLRFKS